MKTFLYSTALSLLLAASAQAQQPLPVAAETPSNPKLTVQAQGINVNGVIEAEHAFCIAAKEGHVTNGPNKSIGLSWYGAPAATKSFAVIAVDVDVPTVFDDAGKEGKTLPDTMPRKDFYHWVLVNIPAGTSTLDAGVDSNAPNVNGKSERQMLYGLRGINDYAVYMASDPTKAGIYAGYDGPCPPWNDERVHHYHFHVYALGVEKLELPINFGGPEAMRALQPHILAQGEVVGTYTLNPALMPKGE